MRSKPIRQGAPAHLVKVGIMLKRRVASRAQSANFLQFPAKKCTTLARP